MTDSKKKEADKQQFTRVSIMISGAKVNHFYHQTEGVETEQYEMNDLSPLNPPEIVLPTLLTLPLVNKEAEKNNWSSVRP